MKKDFVMYAKYNQAGNKAIYDILSSLSNDDREKDRGSYYGTLSGLFRHVMGGTKFFLGMYSSALANNAAAQKILAPLGELSLPEGTVTGSQWEQVGAKLAALDASYVALTEALSEADLENPVKVDWWGKDVPLSFMLHQLVVHNIHHRGQISQILDSLKIDNDYSGIEIDLLPR